MAAAGKPPPKPRKMRHPVYKDFRVEFIDQHGREYALAPADSAVVEAQAGDVDNESFPRELPRDKSVHAGRLALFLRMPINQRWSVSMPDPDGESLRLYHLATQVEMTGKTDGVFVDGPRARTGYLIIRDAISHGQVPDPQAYEAVARDTAKPPGKEWF